MSCNFSENYFFNIVVLKITIDPEIVDAVCFYLPFNSLVFECYSCKQTHFIIAMKTKNRFPPNLWQGEHKE